MEKQIENKTVLTKDSGNIAAMDGRGANEHSVNEQSANKIKGVYISAKDAEEYRSFKKQKRLEEITTAISRSGATLMGNDNIQLVCERAKRLLQVSVKTPPSKLLRARKHLVGSKVKLDCVIGGAGETTTEIKLYEIRLAKRRRANELTVPVTPSLLANCRYAEIRKELRRLKGAAGRAALKVWVDKSLPFNVLSRIARMSSEIGAKYFCVDYFNGCEKLRFDLTGGCQLEISGVEEFTVFRKMTEAGMGRIVTDRVWEFYSEWVKEAEKIEIALPTIQPERKTKLPVSQMETSAENKTPTPHIPNSPQTPTTPTQTPTQEPTRMPTPSPQDIPNQPSVDEPILPAMPVQEPAIRPPQTLTAKSEAQKALQEVLSETERQEGARTPNRLEGSDLKFI